MKENISQLEDQHLDTLGPVGVPSHNRGPNLVGFGWKLKEKWLRNDLVVVRSFNLLGKRREGVGNGRWPNRVGVKETGQEEEVFDWVFPHLSHFPPYSHF